jgi:outer membrane lipoprotein-sorting protein
VNGDLPEVLYLLHGSQRRWKTLRAEGEEWRDEERSREAWARRRPRGGIVSVRGAPGPADRDPMWQLWIRRPDKARVEFGAAHRLRVTQITDGALTWMTLPNGEGRVHEQGGRPQLGPAGVLIETAGISAAFDLDVVGRTRALGRDAFTVRARPRIDDVRSGPRFHPLVSGGDEVHLAVDAERGVLLRLEAILDGAPFYRLEMTEVGFDEELPDETFAFPREDERTATVGDDRGGPNISRRRPMAVHGGPPDQVIGRPTGIHVVWVQTESVVIVVDNVIAYPTGFELHLTVRTRDRYLPRTTESAHPRTWGGSAAFPGESLRFGVLFPDGRRVFSENFPGGSRQDEGDLTLVPLSGSGTTGRFDQRFWVTPLPPGGALGLVVEWSARGVTETRVDVPGEAIRDAAFRAVTLWEVGGTDPERSLP